VLRPGGSKLLDIQWITPHLEKFGAVEISRQTHLRQLTAALHRTANFSAGVTVIPES